MSDRNIANSLMGVAGLIIVWLATGLQGSIPNWLGIPRYRVVEEFSMARGQLVYRIEQRSALWPSYFQIGVSTDSADEAVARIERAGDGSTRVVGEVK